VPAFFQDYIPGSPGCAKRKEYILSRIFRDIMTGAEYNPAHPGISLYCTEKHCSDPHMAAEKVKSVKPETARQSPCGTHCPDFVTKTCPGEDPKCALFWRFSEGIE
jgi:hypothetical protein